MTIAVCRGVRFCRPECARESQPLRKLQGGFTSASFRLLQIQSNKPRLQIRAVLALGLLSPLGKSPQSAVRSGPRPQTHLCHNREKLMRSKTALFGCVMTAVTVAILVAVPGRARRERKTESGREETNSDATQVGALIRRRLDGLANQDFGKINTAADGLLECVKDVTWKINETEKYLLLTNEFLRRVEDLKKAAKDKNIDAASLAYVDMTLTCAVPQVPSRRTGERSTC